MPKAMLRCSPAKTDRFVSAKSLGFHEHGIECVACSPDGRLLATGSLDKSAVVSDLDAGVLRIRTCHSWGVTAVGFSRDGKLLASASDRISVLDLETGSESNQIQWLIEEEVETSELPVILLAFSADGRLLATTSLCSLTAAKCSLSHSLQM